MSTSDRPAPEHFLKLIESGRRGRLKIYIGHAAGTGKTLQMLKEGNDLLTLGKDVVGAYIETHGRRGTDAALGNLPLIPRKRIEYKGANLEEMDLDAVLARHPEIAIVDELAHTNAPGSRNPKRWQDVDELLDVGISVITAVNIQHIESLNLVVERITGVRVQETVPDSFFAAADQVVNLDISSADLRERMKRGEIYAMEKVEVALSNFFTQEKLGSLRELALREVARYLDRARREPGFTSEHRHPLGSMVGPNGVVSQEEKEKALLSPLAEADVDPVVMVASSSRPPDIRSLLRKAAAIADRLNTHWYLAYVETPRESTEKIDATTHRILMNNISLAKDLGATVVRLKGNDVARTLADFAREYGVTHAIFGSSPTPAGFQAITRLFKPDVVTRFHQLSPQVDLHIAGQR